MDITQTCGACPEQYDVFDAGTRAGYMRLRHGLFTVECPDTGDGVIVDEERVYWLRKGQEAIQEWLDSVALYINPQERP